MKLSVQVLILANIVLVHEPTFRAQLMEVIPRPPHQAWQVLLFVIAALGSFSSATESTDIDLALFKEAEKRFSVDMLETGSILLVQATALMANYLQKRNKPNSAYNYLGLAKRVAMGIGLHKELNDSNTRLLKLEEKRRTWWCLSVFDSGATITFSRPMDFPTGGIEVNLPLNVDDSVCCTPAESFTSELTLCRTSPL
jgi:transcriptional regulatory protein GAL4